MHKLTFIALSIVLFTACTSNTKEIPGPEIFLQMAENGFDFDVDSTEIIEPKITYDIDSEYAWSEDDAVFLTEKDYEFKKEELKSHHYLFEVKTPYGTSEMTIPVHVLHINMFEEDKEKLNDDGYHNNPDNGYHLYKNYIQYPVDFNTDLSNEWSGFASSDNTNITDATIKNEFSVYNASGADESEVFSVFKHSDSKEHRITFNDNKEHAIKSISVNNSTYTYLTMIENFEKKEGKDFLLLTVYGYDIADNLTNTVEFYLADYRPEITNDKYIISEWNEIDLSSLGNVQSIQLKLSSSVDDTNFVLPKYVCIDNLKIKS